LAVAIDAGKWPFSFSGYEGPKPISGKIRGDNFRVQMRHYYWSECRPFFYGHFVPSDEGTLIEGDFRMYPYARWFMVIWFSLLALVLVFTLLNSLSMGPICIFIVIVILALMALGVFMIKLSWWMSREDQRTIVDMLNNVLEASESEAKVEKNLKATRHSAPDIPGASPRKLKRLNLSI
jgi:hypothetical protein